MLYSFLENSAAFPSLMHNVGLALISIFLTAIIFIYTAAQKEMQAWDRNIILTKVVNTTDFFIYLFLIFIPPFFWDLSCTFKLIIMGSFMFGTFMLFIQLKNIYLWIIDLELEHDPKDLNSGFRQKLREDFLSEPRDHSEKIRIWAMTLAKVDINPYLQRRLTKIFFDQVLILVQTNQWKLASEYLEIFNANKGLRSIHDWPTIDFIFDGLLRLDYLEFKEIKNENQDGKYEYIYCSHLITELLQTYVKDSIKNGGAFILFNALKDHFIDKEGEYIDGIIAEIAPMIFVNVPEASDSHSIWESYFPAEWKITDANLQGNKVAEAFFKAFIDWIKDRVNLDNKWDKVLEEVNREMLPVFSINIWAELITFIFVRPNDNMLDYVKSIPNFGRIEKIFVGWLAENENESTIDNKFREISRDKRDSTIAFVVKYFFKINNWFSKRDVEETISKLRALENLSNEEEVRRSKLGTLFSAVLEKL